MPFLEETLNSVREQSLPADEVIVVENGSDDGTAEFLAAQSDVRTVVQPQAVSAARNYSTAISLATGDFVKMLFADDLLVTTSIERQVLVLAANPNCVFATGRRDIIGPDSSTLIQSVGLAGMRGVVNGRLALRRALTLGTNPFGEPSALMFRRVHLQSLLPWPDGRGYATDLAMYVRILQSGDVYLDNQVVAKFRISHKTWSFNSRQSHAESVSRVFRDAIAQNLVEASHFRMITGQILAKVRQFLRALVYLRLRLNSMSSLKDSL